MNCTLPKKSVCRQVNILRLNAKKQWVPGHMICEFIALVSPSWSSYPGMINRVKHFRHIWVFPKTAVPQNGWFIMENPIKMDDLGVPYFLETPILYMWNGSMYFTCHTSWTSTCMYPLGLPILWRAPLEGRGNQKIAVGIRILQEMEGSRSWKWQYT